MPLGDIDQPRAAQEWTTHSVHVPDMTLQQAMPDLQAVILLLQNGRCLKVSLFLDDVSLILRR